VQVATCFAVLCVASPALLSGQSSGCSSKESLAQLRTNDPVYIDAVELARTLDTHDFKVKCILASKMGQLFEGQKGAALFRTNQGAFEVLFLPKAESFAAVEVIERRENGRYLYSFGGIPRCLTHMDSSKPAYFIKFANILFIAWGDHQLAANLEAKLTH